MLFRSELKRVDNSDDCSLREPQVWASRRELRRKSRFAVHPMSDKSESVPGCFATSAPPENRAAVKCVEMGEGSFVYFAVSGPQKETVERLRNQIAQKL